MSARRQVTADRAVQVVSARPSGQPGTAGTAKPERVADAAEPEVSAETAGAGAAGGGGTKASVAAGRPGKAAARGANGKPEASQASRRGKRGRQGAAGQESSAGQSASAGQSVTGPLPTRVPGSQQARVAPGPGAGAAAAADELPVRKPARDGADAEPGGQSPSGLSARLMALARLIQIGAARSGREGFSKRLLAEAEDVLARAGERMRLSSGHTVVVLAGGTGSGKSSLFNRLAGADFSTVGVTRPVTKDAHACIWGDAGSGALLEWLGVPARYRYSRESALDSGEDDLAGLVLLDLPDHDSVMAHAGGLVDRLVSLADVMVWVLDPQKYADAAVHRRFLVPLAGHSDVLAVVLNQSDLLDASQIDDCVADLRRLLDSEDLHEVPILVTSAVTGAGLDKLRELLVAGVAARRAAAARISADVDGVVRRFEPYAGDAQAPAHGVPADSRDALARKLTAAAGVDAVADALTSARELRAADFVGWPVAWLVQRMTGRDPMRKVRLGMLWNDLRLITAGPAGAQQAEIDNALTELGDELGEPLPRPWSQTVRTAVRSRADQIPAAVGAAIGEALPAEDSIVWWWRLAGLWQGLLLGAVAVAIAWMAVIVVFGVFHAAAHAPALFGDVATLPWVGGAGIVALVLGAITARACMSLVAKTAQRENAQIGSDMKQRIAGVAAEMVIMPAEQELSELKRYRDEIKVAANGAAEAPAS